jgi:hypothetical protein
MYYNGRMKSQKPEKKIRKAAVAGLKKKPFPPVHERKDQLLQARVPKSLYDLLVTRARQLRVPVSNLVRNILEDSARMVGNIVEGGLEIAGALAEKVGPGDLLAVVGWQTMVANQKINCPRCGVLIKKGGNAFLSVGATGGRAIVICPACRRDI